MNRKVVFRQRLLPYLLLAPQLAITILFFFWPAGQAVWFAFLRQDAFGIRTSFVGFENFADLFADPHLLAGGGLLQTAISALGGGAQVGLPALPLEFGEGRDRAGLRRQPPRMGEHNAEVLAEAGFGAAEITALSAAGVVVAMAGSGDA